MPFASSFKKPTSSASTLPVIFKSTVKDAEGLTLVKGKHLITGEDVTVGYYKATDAGLQKRKPLSDLTDKLQPDAVVVFESCYPQADGSWRSRWASAFLKSPDMGKVMRRHVSITHGVSNRADSTPEAWMRIDVLREPTDYAIVRGGTGSVEKMIEACNANATEFPRNISAKTGLDGVVAAVREKITSRVPTANFAFIRAFDDSGQSATAKVMVKRKANTDLQGPVDEAIKLFQESAFYQFLEKEMPNIVAIDIIPGTTVFAGKATRDGLKDQDLKSIERSFPTIKDGDTKIGNAFRQCFVAMQNKSKDGTLFDAPFFNGCWEEAYKDGKRPPAFAIEHIASAIFRGQELNATPSAPAIDAGAKADSHVPDAPRQMAPMPVEM